MSTLTFLKQFLRTPSQVGSVVPSSPALARFVVDCAELEPDHAVVELGAGTGPVTEVLRTRVADDQILAFEPQDALAAVLCQRFPGVTLRQDFAGADLADHTASWGHPQVHRVVSGLPWTMWPKHVQDPVFEGIVDALAPDGRFLTYTYVHSQMMPAARMMRTQLDRYFGEVRRSRVLWANVPPAVVMICDRPRKDVLTPPA